MTYYRDKLDGVSPTDISLLTDLKLEPEKDITALVLKYSMMGLVEIDDDGIRVLSKSHPDLKRSDEILLSKLESRSRFTADWQKAVIDEASASPYFKRDKSYAKNFKVGCAVHFILGIAVFITGIVVLATLGARILDPLSEIIEASGMTELMFYDVVVRDSELFRSAILMIILALFFVLCWYYPAISFIGNLAYLVIGSGTVCPVKRTEEGERLTEYVYGLKNFIHDFSALSEAEKEQLILWDDFLIYAVLLEENDIIVDEIARLRKQSLWKYHGGN